MPRPSPFTRPAAPWLLRRCRCPFQTIEPEHHPATAPTPNGFRESQRHRGAHPGPARRTVRDTLNLIHDLRERGIGIRNLADPIKIDSANPEPDPNHHSPQNEPSTPPDNHPHRHPGLLSAKYDTNPPRPPSSTQKSDWRLPQQQRCTQASWMRFVRQPVGSSRMHVCYGPHFTAASLRHTSGIIDRAGNIVGVMVS